MLLPWLERALLRGESPDHVHRHAAFILERTCAHPRLQHLLRSAYPSDVRQHATRFDQMLLAALTRAGGMVEGRTPAIDDDGGSGIVRRRIALPVSSGGWGMRRMEKLAGVCGLPWWRCLSSTRFWRQAGPRP